MGNRFFAIAMLVGITILSMVCPVDSAWAQRKEKRMALVVGNSNYANVPKLPNPQRDAISVGQMLRDAGFDSVDVIVNASNLEFKRAIRKFEIDVNQADIAVVYYAGHGLEIGGKNYLIPIDAKLASDLDADDEAITLERLVASADGASKLRVIVLDACRDNPFPSLMRRDRRNGQGSISSGLGKTEPTSTDTLIAYAAKAGSTAEDGDGQHSPFAAALLKSLTVPGLDIRLAFGRVRDEVMRATGSRQEPFVYGSLGGGNISLVPAPKTQEASDADVKGDYELVARVGTLRAWEVFLGTHKTGFYADLARAQVASLTEPQSGTVLRSGTPASGAAGAANKGNNTGSGNVVVADVPPSQSGRDSSTGEALEWNRIKDSSDPAVFAKFIEKYPNAPLAVAAQKRLDILRQSQHEREAAQKAAEDARVQAEQQRAAEAAAKQREQQERLAREAEAAQKAKAAEAERKAAEARQKAEQAERDRAAAEAAAARAAAEKQARDAEEARKKVEFAAKEAACKTEQSKLDGIFAKGSAGSGIDDLRAFAATATCERLGARIAAALDRFKADEAKRVREAAQKAAEQQKAEATDKTKADAAALAAQKKQEEDARRAEAEEAERQAKAAETQRRADQAARDKATADAAAARAAAEKQAKEDERRAKAAETEQKAKVAEAERLAAEEQRKADQAAKETACQAEQAKLAQIVAKGSEGTGLDDLVAFARTVTCDRVGPQVLATVDKFKADVAARAAATPNSPQLILAAQTQLIRLGCQLPVKPDGKLNDATKSGLARFLTLKGKPSTDLIITTALVTDLNSQTARVCPLECKSNEVARGDQCVSVDKPAAPAVTSRRKDDDSDAAKRKRQPEAPRQAERKPAPEPRARVQAVARPSGGGGGTMIGVGF